MSKRDSMVQLQRVPDSMVQFVRASGFDGADNAGWAVISPHYLRRRFGGR
jgi:hypothetical protein